jgi:hypothetical protein
VNITALAPSHDGSALFVGGTFTQADRLPRVAAARLDPVTGAVDPAWDAGLEPRTPDLQAQVYDIAVTPEGVHLCGDFQRVHGEPSPNLVRVDATTGARSAGWVATTDGGVNSCAAAGGWLYLGGHFQRVGGANADFKTNPEPTGEPRSHLAAVSLGTGELGPWDPGADSVPGVFAVAVQEGTADGPGRIGIGGAFSRTGGFVRQQGFGQFSLQP